MSKSIEQETFYQLMNRLLCVFNVLFQVFIFLTEICISLNWAVMADILLVSITSVCENKNMNRSAET